jgi:hypothetical protein
MRFNAEFRFRSQGKLRLKRDRWLGPEDTDQVKSIVGFTQEDVTALRNDWEKTKGSFSELVHPRPTRKGMPTFCFALLLQGVKRISRLRHPKRLVRFNLRPAPDGASGTELSKSVRLRRIVLI